MTQTLTAGDDTPHRPEPSRTGQPQAVPQTPVVPQIPVVAQTPACLQTPGAPQTPDALQADPAQVRVGSPASLLAIIPHLLGFMPEASVVVIGLTPPRDRIRVTLRYDLPDPTDADLVTDIAGHAVGVISSQRLTAAIAVGYGPESLVTPVADAVRDAAQRAGIDLHDVLRVEGGRYWSYRCGDEACCPAAGVPFDRDRSFRSRPTWPLPGNRCWLAGPRWPPASRRSAASPRNRCARPPAGPSSTPPGCSPRSAGPPASAPRGSMIAAEGLAAVGTMIARYRGGGRFTSDYEIARITVALRDLRVRDDAWARMDPAHSDAHRRLWIDVTRRAQPGHVAAPAALLAFVAWQSGDGALANVALDRAVADEPRYSMALLLRQVISAGAPPSLARLPMSPEEVAASYDDAEADELAESHDHDHDHDPDADVHDPDLAGEQ